MNSSGIKIFIHPHMTNDAKSYIETINSHKKLLEAMDVSGTLTFTSHNDPFDPWVTAQWFGQDSQKELLIAVNPMYQEPFTTARKISTLLELYRREIGINWITGLALSDSKQLNITRSKKEKYDYLEEYIIVVKEYLLGKSFSFEGKYFNLENAHLNIPNNDFHNMNHYISGQSDYAISLAEKMGLKRLSALVHNYDKKEKYQEDGLAMGLIIGQDEADAWQRAAALFPESRLGKATLDFAMNNTDAVWKKQLFSELDAEALANGFWSKPIENYSEVPYLVGDMDFIQGALRLLADRGIDTFIFSLADELDYKRFKNPFK